MEELCRHLDFPQEVTDRLVSHVRNMDLRPFETNFKELFSLETGEKAVKAIPALCKTEKDPNGDVGLKALMIYLMAAHHTHKVYKEMGISDAVFYETMKAFTRFTKEHKESFGHYGFDRDFWTYRQLSGSIFRLGTLEFEMVKLSQDAPPVGNVTGGSPILSVHIPSDAVLTRRELDASYHMAREFFAEYYPDYRYQCVYCSTWLLSPVLKQVLKPGSGILEFQSDYEITQTFLDSNGGFTWIYKRNYEDYTQLPEDTSLMRGMKQILLNGGKTGAATGYVKDLFNSQKGCLCLSKSIICPKQSQNTVPKHDDNLPCFLEQRFPRLPV